MRWPLLPSHGPETHPLCALPAAGEAGRRAGTRLVLSDEWGQPGTESKSVLYTRCASQLCVYTGMVVRVSLSLFLFLTHTRAHTHTHTHTYWAVKRYMYVHVQYIHTVHIIKLQHTIFWRASNELTYVWLQKRHNGKFNSPDKKSIYKLKKSSNHWLL